MMIFHTYLFEDPNERLELANELLGPKDPPTGGDSTNQDWDDSGTTGGDDDDNS